MGNYPLLNFSVANSLPYQKFMIVRDPIDRVLSAWEDKFNAVCKNYCHNTRSYFGPIIVQNFRPNATAAEIRKGCPTFEEFAQYISEPRTYDFQDIINAPVLDVCFPAQNSANHW